MTRRGGRDAGDEETASTWRTRRQRLVALLEEGGPVDLEFIMREFEYAHKRHLLADVNRVAKAMRQRGRSVLVQPPWCAGCGYQFRLKDGQLRVPSRCPKCKAERVQWPHLRLE